MFPFNLTYMNPDQYKQLQIERITGKSGTTELEIQLVTSICLVLTIAL